MPIKISIRSTTIPVPQLRYLSAKNITADENIIFNKALKFIWTFKYLNDIFINTSIRTIYVKRVANAAPCNCILGIRIIFKPIFAPTPNSVNRLIFFVCL